MVLNPCTYCETLSQYDSVPSPNHPASFKNPSPPPSESLLPPLTPTHILKQPQTPPAPIPESQLSQELETLIKNAAEALWAIV